MNRAVREVAQAKVRRFKPYPAYKDSGVEWLGEVPEHWEVKRIREIAADLQTGPFGSQLHADEYVLGGYPVINPANLREGELVQDPKCTVDDAAASRLAHHGLREGDILFARRGELGRCGLVTRQQEGWLCGTGCLRLRVQAVNARPHYLMRLLSTSGVADWLGLQSVGATMQNLNTSIIGRIPIVMPPTTEQGTIADFLDRETAKIDALVAKKERLIELLQDKRTTLITCAVTKGIAPNAGLVATGAPAFREMPEGWRLRKLRRLIGRVKRPVLVEPETEYREIGIRSWGKGVFHKDPVRGALLEDKSVFCIEPGDLVLNIVFAWEGAVAVVSEGERGMVASHRFPTFRPSDEVHLDYLLLFLQSQTGRGLMGINSPGAAGRNRTIRLDQFLDEEMALPPLAEQIEIVVTFRREESRLGALLSKVRDAIDRLKELRTALISAAVTGKIDVREGVV